MAISSTSDAVGIDLGTNYSSVGVWRDGKCIVISNDYGYPTTPSVVAFTPKERLIGDAAQNQSISNARNIVVGIKRLIGHKYKEELIQDDLKTWMFKVNDQEEYDKPQIVVELKHEVQKYCPEEIMAMIITKLKRIAENFIKHTVNDVVVTVPACFNDSQRQAILDAGTIAGVHIRQLVNDTLAAALKYGFNNLDLNEKNILVADFGAGSLNVSVVTISNETNFRVRSHTGDPHLGGEDFTTQLVEFCIADFNKTKTKKDIRDSVKSMHRLRLASERAKCILSKHTFTEIDIDALFESEDYVCNISRARFEELCFDLFRKVTPLFEKAVKDSGLDLREIHDVILTGGSSHIPKYQSLVKKFFDDRFPLLAVSPDDTVVQGASIYAGIIVNDSSHRLEDYQIQDIAYYPLGVDARARDFMKISDRGTPIPYTVKKIFSTLHEYQTGITIEVFEGNRIMERDQNLLGTFDICFKKNFPFETPQVEVTFFINRNGILHLSAEEAQVRRTMLVQVKEDKGRLSGKEIQQMRSRAVKLEHQDLHQIAMYGFKDKLESYIFNLRQAIADAGHKMNVDDRKLIKRECEKLLNWLDQNGVHADKADFEVRYQEISHKCDPILAKVFVKGQDKDVFQSEL